MPRKYLWIERTEGSSQGSRALGSLRDRAGTFEPQLLGKYQRRLPGFDEKILALYAKGMTKRYSAWAASALVMWNTCGGALQGAGTVHSRPRA